MSERLYMECKGCGVHCHDTYFSLCRQIEQIKEIDPDTVETIVSGCDQLGAWCDRCGVDAALAELASIGIAAVPACQDPPNRPCSKCRQTVVREDEPHVAYVISEDIIEGQAVSVLDLTHVSNVCTACELPVDQGGAS